MSSPHTIDKFALSVGYQWILSLISFFFVAFGQPAWLPLNGFISSAIGFALFWRVLLAHSLSKNRFYLATAWFCSVQLVQLSWFISHPYAYIYLIYFFLSVMMGLQFGVIALFIRPDLFVKKEWLQTIISFFVIASLWTIFEWIRLLPLSGFSWNPIGIAMASNIYSMQAASLAGIFALSFWVILANLFGLKAIVQKKFLAIVVWLIIVILPYLYGFLQISSHDSSKDLQTTLTAMLVQTGFSPEEVQGFPNEQSRLKLVVNEWKKILEATKKHQGKSLDLLVLPELVVPYGTYSDVYSLLDIFKAFYEVFGSQGLSTLPDLDYPFFSLQQTRIGPQILVNNAYWAQALANFFQADILLGLEDAEDMPHGAREYYSSAIFIHPQKKDKKDIFTAQRYSKRVLVPMGEYIPFEACRRLAQRYGVFGSFTCGKEAVVMHSNKIPFSPSICYEETFGDIIREGRQKGANLFINLTSDVWYPNSKLPKQHLEHARLRTVENGVPLLRACNTGITIAIDSLGRDLEVLGGEHPEKVEWISDSLLVKIPIDHYRTFYSYYGDKLIIYLSFFMIVASFLYKKKIGI